jgi:hypothetical protein
MEVLRDFQFLIQFYLRPHFISYNFLLVTAWQTFYFFTSQPFLLLSLLRFLQVVEIRVEKKNLRDLFFVTWKKENRPILVWNVMKISDHVWHKFLNKKKFWSNLLLICVILKLAKSRRQTWNTLKVVLLFQGQIINSFKIMSFICKSNPIC